MTYTVYKLQHNANNEVVLGNKEHLNNIDEVNAWLVAKMFNNVLIVQDNTEICKVMYRVQNCEYQVVKSGKLGEVL